MPTLVRNPTSVAFLVVRRVQIHVLLLFSLPISVCRKKNRKKKGKESRRELSWNREKRGCKT